MMKQTHRYCCSRAISNGKVHYRTFINLYVLKLCLNINNTLGDIIRDSPPPIGREDGVKLICKSYFLANTDQSLFRRFVILLIYLACGRAGEVALTFWSLISWNYTIKNVYFNWSQSKTSKQKGIAVLPDKDCFFHGLVPCIRMSIYNNVLLQKRVGQRQPRRKCFSS